MRFLHAPSLLLELGQGIVFKGGGGERDPI